MPSFGEWQRIQEGEEKALRAVANKGGFDKVNQAGWYSVITEDFSLTLDFFKGKKILEIGGGVEGMLSILEDAYLRVGLDPLAGRLQDLYLNHEHERRVEQVTGIGERLPFPNGIFDIVIVYNVLQHTIDPGVIIQECYRVLTDAGFLLFEDASFGRLPGFIRNRLTLIDGLHPFHFNEKELEGFLKKADFEITYCYAAKKDTLESVTWRFKIRRWKAGVTLFFAMLAGIKNCHYVCKKG